MQGKTPPPKVIIELDIITPIYLLHLTHTIVYAALTIVDCTKLIEMAMKWLVSAASAPSSECSPKRRKVMQLTFKKWQTQHEKEYQTLSWLHSNSDSKTALIKALWCAVCRKFEDRICSVTEVCYASKQTENLLDHNGRPLLVNDWSISLLVCHLSDQAKKI